MELIDTLAEEFGQDTILFVGSGVSVQSGLPKWNSLISWLREYTLSQGGCIELANTFLDKKDYTRATNALVYELEKIGKTLANFFIDYDGCNIFREAEPNETHQLISSLPTNSIITPNYDLLLEKIYNNKLKVVHRGDVELISKIEYTDLKDFLFKYHGCISKPEQIVLDHNDYIKEIHGNSLEVDCLRHLIQSRTIVFIGAGLDDPDFNFVMDNIRHKYGPKNLKLWAFMGNCSSVDLMSYYKDTQGINLINYKKVGDDHTDLNNKLRELIEKIRTHQEEKPELIRQTSQDSGGVTIQKDFLRAALDKANEEVIPLDKQILGFTALFDTATKNECIEYLTEYKGYELNTILNRVEHLVERQLLKETINHLLPIKKEFSVQAAEMVEEDILEYLAVRQNG